MKIMSGKDVIAQLSLTVTGEATPFFDSAEGLSAFVRLVASYVCPCTERFLRASVQDLITGLSLSQDDENVIPSIIRSMSDHGDLIETYDADRRSTVLSLRTPSAFALSPSKVIILGLAPNGTDPLPKDLRDAVRMRGCVRLLEVSAVQEALSKLHAAGFLVITSEEWGLPPAPITARKLIDSYTSRFRQDSNVGHIEGLRLLDHRTATAYYQDRWDALRLEDGDYVARRSRRYGNDAWCFVRMVGRQASGLVDLPTKGFNYRACDEAWHLQQAIDFETGTPQRYRIVTQNESESILEFTSPIPQWAHRRWTLTGTQTVQRGALFAYRFSSGDLGTEIDFVEKRMWLAPL